MRRTLSIAVWLLLAGCSDNSADRVTTKSDAGASQTDAGKIKPDAGTSLERPGALAKPPKTGLPADLRPPR